MRLDSESQQEYLLQLIGGFTFTNTGADNLLNTASAVQELKAAITNAEIAASEETADA